MSKWQKFCAAVKKWWPTAVPVLITIWTAVGPQIGQWVTTHPRYSVFFSAIAMIVAHFKQSPVAAK